MSNIRILNIYISYISIFTIQQYSVDARCPVPSKTCGFKFQSSWCRVRVAGFGVQGAGCRVHGSGFRVEGSGFRA
jgi:hypothetical protein